MVLLKGHQIIGELRPSCSIQEDFACIERSPDHWWVTTNQALLADSDRFIERSPDHWWVTTYQYPVQTCHAIERSPDHWWVTTTKGRITNWAILIERSPDHWWVTTEDSWVT